MRKKKGFTLIELLVVIAIIALLLSIMAPALKKTKERARAMMCKSNLHQWAVVFLMYTNDNHDKFWEDGPMPTGGHVKWLPMLAELYGNMDDFRLCPSATRQRTPPGIGATFFAWGGTIFTGHGFGNEQSRNYASYGTNLWINSVYLTQGWGGMPERQWQTTLQKDSVSEIPMIFDCVWFGTNPMTIDDPLFNRNVGAVPTYRDLFERMDPLAPDWSWNTGRLCIDRHNKGVIIAFMDGSASKVILNDIWSKNWHKDYKKVYNVKIPWLN